MRPGAGRDRSRNFTRGRHAIYRASADSAVADSDLRKGAVMSDTIEKPESSQAGSRSSRRRFFRRAAIATAIATAIAALVTGLGVRAYAHGPGGWHRGGFLGATLDPARVDEHIDRM